MFANISPVIMAIKIVPTEVWEKMREYMTEDAVLVPEPALEKMPQDKQELIRQNVGEIIDYDFGGEPDIEFDIVTTPNHFLFDALSDSNDTE